MQIDALEMILLRIAYSASLPSPAELLKELKKKSGLNNASVKIDVSGDATEIIADSAEKNIVLQTPEDLVKLLTANRQPLLCFSLKNDMSFHSFSHGEMSISLSLNAPKDLIANLRKFLQKETGTEWKINIDYEPLGETLAFLERKDLEQNCKNISEYPLVKAILDEFNGAKIETIIHKSVEAAEDENPAEFSAESFNNYNDEE